MISCCYISVSFQRMKFLTVVVVVVVVVFVVVVGAYATISRKTLIQKTERSGTHPSIDPSLLQSLFSEGIFL